MRSLREHGLRIGELEAGPRCSIADVDGVRVGHVTLVRDEAEPPCGRGVARTGVTAIVPAPPDTLHAEPLRAGVAVLNGAGEMTGSLQVAERGVVETPVYLTATIDIDPLFEATVDATEEAGRQRAVGRGDDGRPGGSRRARAVARRGARAARGARPAARVNERPRATSRSPAGPAVHTLPPKNNGGLFGERAGWALPGFADAGWETVSLPHTESAPGIA